MSIAAVFSVVACSLPCAVGQVTGGQVTGGQVTGGQVTGGQVTGGQVTVGQATGGGLAADSMSEVVAMLGKQPITRAEVDFQLGRLDEQDLPALTFSVEQTAIHLIAQQRQALQTLRRLNLAASRDEVEKFVLSQNASWTREAAANAPVPGVGSAADIADAVAARWGISRQAYFDLFAFRLSWKRYLAKFLTEENVARHFRNQSARFDGTKFKMFMVSIPVAAGQSVDRSTAQEDFNSVISALGEVFVRDEIIEASRARGWEVTDQTWVRGTGSLDPLVMSAILELDVGQRSQPFDTAGGVHMVWLLDRIEGTKQIDEVRDEVRAHMLVYLLGHLASQSSEELPLRPVQANQSDRANHDQ